MLPIALLELLDGAELELLETSEEELVSEELEILEELETLEEELDISDELNSVEELDKEISATEEEPSSVFPKLSATLEEITLDAISLEDAIIELLATDELSTVELTRLEEAFEEDFTMALDELPVETGGFEVLPAPQALSTRVSEKAVKALNVYKLRVFIISICHVVPHPRRRNYC